MQKIISASFYVQQGCTYFIFFRFSFPHEKLAYLGVTTWVPKISAKKIVEWSYKRGEKFNIGYPIKGKKQFSLFRKGVNKLVEPRNTVFCDVIFRLNVYISRKILFRRTWKWSKMKLSRVYSCSYEFRSTKTKQTLVITHFHGLRVRWTHPWGQFGRIRVPQRVISWRLGLIASRILITGFLAMLSSVLRLFKL